MEMTEQEQLVWSFEKDWKYRVGRRLENAIIRNIPHKKRLKDEQEALELAKKRIEMDMKERMNVFVMKSQAAVAKYAKRSGKVLSNERERTIDSPPWIESEIINTNRSRNQ